MEGRGLFGGNVFKNPARYMYNLLSMCCPTVFIKCQENFFFLGGIFQFNQAKFSLSEVVGSRDISVVIENIGNIQFGANLR